MPPLPISCVCKNHESLWKKPWIHPFPDIFKKQYLVLEKGLPLVMAQKYAKSYYLRTIEYMDGRNGWILEIGWPKLVLLIIWHQWTQRKNFEYRDCFIKNNSPLFRYRCIVFSTFSPWSWIAEPSLESVISSRHQPVVTNLRNTNWLIRAGHHFVGPK